MSDGLAALREMLAPATQTTVTSEPPKVRKNRCGKCPFGGAKLTAGERDSAEMLKLRLADRLASGESVVWGCHETVHGGKPQVCPGFIAWRSS